MRILTLLAAVVGALALTAAVPAATTVGKLTATVGVALLMVSEASAVESASL